MLGSLRSTLRVDPIVKAPVFPDPFLAYATSGWKGSEAIKGTATPWIADGFWKPSSSMMF